jgi:hypothetical protein
MGMERGFDEKIDVIDLIISVLREHEGKLDELVSRLEEAQVTPVQVRALQEPREPPEQVGAAITAILKSWADFTGRGSGAKLVAVDIADGFFEASAVAGGVVYIYREEIPSLDIQYTKGDDGVRIESIDISKANLMPAALKGRLDCGLEFEKRDVEVELPGGRAVHKILYHIDPGTAKSWLAYQLGVDDSAVIQGRLQT